jgi:hypothetical protein
VPIRRCVLASQEDWLTGGVLRNACLYHRFKTAEEAHANAESSARESLPTTPASLSLPASDTSPKLWQTDICFKTAIRSSWVRWSNGLRRICWRSSNSRLARATRFFQRWPFVEGPGPASVSGALSANPAPFDLHIRKITRNLSAFEPCGAATRSTGYSRQAPRRFSFGSFLRNCYRLH